MGMKKARLFLYLPLFLLFSFLLSFFLLFSRQTSKFSFLNHSFRPEVPSFFLLAFFFFLSLLGIWLLYSRIVSKFFSLKYGETLSQDFLTFLPIVFLSLTPLTLTHYLTNNDLLARLKLSILAIIFTFFYLKFIQIYRWSREKQAPWKEFLEKISSLSLKKKLAFLFLAALIIYNAGSALMTSRGMAFSGDEPHYLLITHSILHDGDFNLENNYAQRDYRSYMFSDVKLSPHVVLGAKKEGRFSFHSPGLSLFLSPFYALGSLFGKKFLVLFIRFGMSIFGALFGLQIFLFARQEWQKEKLAFWLWFLASFSAPLFFYSIHVYPEIIIALFSFTIYRLLRFSGHLSREKILLFGFLLSLFLWFHALKYLFILLPLFLYTLWILVKKYKIGWNLGYFFAFPFGLTILYFLFQYFVYGSFSIFSATLRGATTGEGSLNFLKTLFSNIPFRYRLETLAGYLLDQRDGLLLYSPLYFFALLGAVEMIKRKGRDFLTLLFLTSPYILNLAFLAQRTAYAPQARTQIAVFWGMAILLSYFLVYNDKKIFSYFFSLAASLSFVFVYLLLKNPLFLYQETTSGTTEHAGGLFLFLSNLHFYLPDFLPSFLKVEEKWLPNFIWIGLLLLFIAAYLALKKHTFNPRFSFHLLLAFSGIAVFLIWFALYPRVVLLNPVKAPFPSGKSLTFYSLSRVARMSEPGKFLLLEDNRPYNFYFTSWRKIENLQIEFGSLEGNYSLDLSLFDHKFFTETTAKEIKSKVFFSPPLYRLRKTNLYRISIYLENKSEVLTGEKPYLFSIKAQS